MQASQAVLARPHDLLADRLVYFSPTTALINSLLATVAFGLIVAGTSAICTGFLPSTPGAHTRALTLVHVAYAVSCAALANLGVPSGYSCDQYSPSQVIFPNEQA